MLSSDRLNAKISAQSLEIKENYARINSYEKELARVDIFEEKFVLFNGDLFVLER